MARTAAGRGRQRGPARGRRRRWRRRQGTAWTRRGWPVPTPRGRSQDGRRWAGAPRSHRRGPRGDRAPPRGRDHLGWWLAGRTTSSTTRSVARSEGAPMQAHAPPSMGAVRPLLLAELAVPAVPPATVARPDGEHAWTASRRHASPSWSLPADGARARCRPSGRGVRLVGTDRLAPLDESDDEPIRSRTCAVSALDRVAPHLTGEALAVLRHLGWTRWPWPSVWALSLLLRRPAGLHPAALSMRRSQDPESVAMEVRGDDRPPPHGRWLRASCSSR